MWVVFDQAEGPGGLVDVRCQVFGAVSCRSDEADGAVAPLRGQVALVFAALVHSYPRALTTDALTFAIWGDHAPPTARTGLHVVVNRLRKRLGHESVTSSNGMYSLAVSRSEIDVMVFEELATHAQLLFDERAYVAVVERCQKAEQLWCGEPFGQFNEVDQFRPAVERLRALRAQLGELEARALLELGLVDRSVLQTAELTTREPYREEGWRLRMVALYRSGRAVDSLDAFEKFRTLLAEDLGLTPSPGLVEFELAVLRHDHETLGAPSPVVAPEGVAPSDALRRSSSTALMKSYVVDVAPHDDTWFAGRDTELDQLEHRLQNDQVVCITGPPGVGKSRLATEFLHRHTSECARLWVDLAYESAERVEARVAQLFGIVDGETDRTLHEAARLISSDWPVLLVLDNCEHVIEQTRSLISALDDIAAVSILITSRVPTGHPSEYHVQLEALEPAHAMDVLRDRVDAGVGLSDADAQAVVAACDYLPLAIELVAHQLSASSADVVTRGLAESNRSLRVGRESLDDRLRASIDLLSPIGNDVFHSLAPFAGRFDATAVASLAAVSERAAARGLEELVSHSLLTIERQPVADLYGMLETVHRTAVDSARWRGDLRRLQAAHASYYAQCAADNGAALRTGNEDVAAARFHHLTSQLWAAWQRCHEHGYADNAADLVVGTGEWALYRLRWNQLGWAPQLDESNLELPINKRAAVLAQCARSAWGRGHALAAIAYGERSVAEAASLKQRTPLAAHFALMSAFGQVGDYRSGYRHVVEAQDQAEESNEDYYLVGVLATQSMAMNFLGEQDQALTLARRARGVAENLGNRSAIAWGLYAQALCRTEREPAAAADQMQLAAEQADKVSNRLVQGLALAGAATCLRRAGDHKQAAALLSALLGHWEQVQIGPHMANIIGETALLLADAGRQRRAERLVEALSEFDVPYPHLPDDNERLSNLKHTTHVPAEENDFPSGADLLDSVRSELALV